MRPAVGDDPSAYLFLSMFMLVKVYLFARLFKHYSDLQSANGKFIGSGFVIPGFLFPRARSYQSLTHVLQCIDTRRVFSDVCSEEAGEGKPDAAVGLGDVDVHPVCCLRHALH